MNWHNRHTKRVGLINRIMKENIDFQMQDEHYSCGAAAIQNIFRLLGRKMPAEEKLMDDLRTTEEKGTAPEMIEMYLVASGVKAKRFLKHESLDEELSKNRILFVEFQDYLEDQHPVDVKLKQASHFALIVGMDDASYYCIDSYLPKIKDTRKVIKKIPKARFHRDWVARSFDGQEVVERYGLIIQI